MRIGNWDIIMFRHLCVDVLESTGDPRNMPGPIFAMFQLLTGTHAGYVLVKRDSTAEADETNTPTQ